MNVRVDKPNRRRPGSILILVVLVLGTLSLGAYWYSERCVNEYQALRSGIDDIRSFQAAESAIDYTTQQLALARGKSPTTSRLQWLDSQGDTLQVAIYAASPHATYANMDGVFDECGKLNLNSLALDAEHEVESRQRLLMLPGMTNYVADAILDWIDRDEVPRQFGAESQWYLSNGFPYTPRQGPMERLAEVVLVRGVTAQMLWGHDTDGSGWLETNERLALEKTSRQSPTSPTLGWSEWLTVISARSQLKQNDAPKVNLNQPSLLQLYQQVNGIAGQEAARFIVSLRMNGPLNDDNVMRFDSAEAIENRRATAASRARRQTEESLQFDPSNRGTIEGLSLRAPIYQFESLIDLIDRRVEVQLESNDIVLNSPWTVQNGTLRPVLEWLDQNFTTAEEPQTPGAINPNLADQVVLQTIPGLTVELAKTIVQRRPRGRSDIAWLVDDRLLSLSQLRSIAKFLTSSGDVYSGVCYGTVAGSQRTAAISFVVDATLREPHIQQRIRRPSMSHQLREDTK